MSPAPPIQTYAVGDLPLESGEAIRDFRLTYVTHGTLSPARDNAILVLPSITGTHRRHDNLIGPGRALDPERYFVICSDTIGNGIATSPSNSREQPRMRFPRFTIRDMVHAQHRLVTEHLKLDHLLCVMGLSMGGMQTFQWGASHPDFMDALIPIIPLTRTPPWTTAVLEACRKAIMADAAWSNGEYATPPEKGMRAWRDLQVLIVRTPEWFRHQLPPGLDVREWLRQQEDALIPQFDANDFIYQSWAYDQHDIARTPGCDGDWFKALQQIRARVLILAAGNDLLNPESDPRDAHQVLRDSRYVTIPSLLGHLAGGLVAPAETEFVNEEVGRFLARLRPRPPS